jgi:serine/threonine-protein kinase
MEPGTLLGERYRVGERIDADTWLAEDTMLPRTVEVRALPPALLDRPGFLPYLRGLAEALMKLHDAGAIEIYDYVLDPALYLVLEHVAGERLSSIIARSGPLPPARTMALVAQVARVLAAGHLRGVCHGALTARDILVRPDGTVVLCDFGFAGLLEGRYERSNQYIPPTEAANKRTPLTDVYALGLVAHHCLTGSPPSGGDAVWVPGPLPPSVPAPVAALVGAALAAPPDRPTAVALADAASLLGDRPG